MVHSFRRSNAKYIFRRKNTSRAKVTHSQYDSSSARKLLAQSMTRQKSLRTGMMHCQGNHHHQRAVTFHKIQHRLPYSLTVLPTTETCLPSLSLTLSLVPFLKAFHQLAPNFVWFLMSKKKRKFRNQIKICLPKIVLNYAKTN